MYVEQIVQWGNASARSRATPVELSGCEHTLGHPIPSELRAILSEADGIEGEYGLELVWPVARMAEDNNRFRTDPVMSDLYMSFESLIFFSDAGNGDQFFVSLAGNQDVYCWDHEDDSRVWVAGTVMEFLEAWMSGERQL